MISSLPPAAVMILGAAVTPLMKGRLRSFWLLLLPLLCLAVVHAAPEGTHWVVRLWDYDLVLGQIDRLSRLFGYVFSMAAFVAALFALQVKDDLQHVSALIYAGSALGVALAGDFLSVYVFWELMAVASTFLILAQKTKPAQGAAFRYILFHLFGGLLFLAGILLRMERTSSLSVGFVGLEGLDNWLIFLGIAVNAAVPPFHPWLKDAYPEATPMGGVYLSVFTTKSAVYLLVRTFTGAEELIWIGAAMALYPLLWAMMENNVRRVLSYIIINQVGFMVCGVGLGTPLALNGVAAHAFSHILYDALLFMAAGAVLQVTGKTECTQWGGLFRRMPLTVIFYLVGAASISALPLFSGFVSKSMIISAAGEEKTALVWLALEFASAGVFIITSLKVLYHILLGPETGPKGGESPLNMLAAMCLAAVACLLIGLAPGWLYGLLPHPVSYAPYTRAHVLGQLELLIFGASAFAVLCWFRVYPLEKKAVLLDLDWFYRQGGRGFYRLADGGLNGLNEAAERLLVGRLTRRVTKFFEDGPARLVLAALRPVWILAGVHGGDLARKKEKVALALRAGGIPLGLGAAVVTIMLMAVFLLR